jgi:hypothetical protein
MPYIQTFYTENSLIREALCAGGGRKTRRNLKGNKRSRKPKVGKEDRETEELIALAII